MSDCQTCALRDAGQDTDLSESIRGQRLLLALLNGAPDVVELVATEVHGCAECLGRLAAYYLGNAAASLVYAVGSIDNAMSVLSCTLAEDLDKIT